MKILGVLIFGGLLISCSNNSVNSISQKKGESKIRITFADISLIKDSSSSFEAFFDSIRIVFNNKLTGPREYIVKNSMGAHSLKIHLAGDTALSSWVIKTDSNSNYLITLKYFAPVNDTIYSMHVHNKTFLSKSEILPTPEYYLNWPKFEMKIYNTDSIKTY